MGLWQFKIELVPRRAVRDSSGVIPFHIDNQILADTEWWAGAPSLKLHSYLNNLLLKDDSWSSEVSIWKENSLDEGNEVHLLHEESDQKNIQHILVRIDCRELSDKFLRLAGEISSLCDGVYFSSTGKYVGSDPKDILLSIKASGILDIGDSQDRLSSYLRRNYVVE